MTTPWKRRIWIGGSVLAVCLLVFAGFHLIRKHTGATPSAAGSNSSAPSYLLDGFAPVGAQSQRPGRGVYPYSVIPGGVFSAAELKTAVSKDPVVRAHYADFQASAARVIMLPAAKEVHVSYRLGNKVFWTKKTIKLRPGETLLTDGLLYSRTRCGNRTSEVPQGPTTANEPPTEALEMAQDPPIETAPGLRPQIPLAQLPETAINQPKKKKPGGLFLIPPPFWFPGSSGTPPTPAPPPPLPTPEPSTLALFVAGAAALLLARKAKSHRR